MSNDFLTDLFGDQEGIVYSPIKGDIWEQYFFNWPQERTLLEEHINDFNTREVYLSPVMFKKRVKSPDGKHDTIFPENFKGTHFLWTEFDGNTPTDAIQPSMRVGSSISGHEHWYWKLDAFATDKIIVEDLTRRIAFHYGADLSAWDYQQVLRPVDTWNHKRNRPVTLLSRTDTIYSISDFLKIPIPAAGTKVEISLSNLPFKEQILAKYRWTPDALDLMFKEIKKGSRSDALARLAHEAIESGCSNEETFVLLEERDSVWGKFVGRTDRHRRLEALIANVRRQKATVAEIVQGAPEVYRFMDFMNTNIHLKWAIEGLLPVAGSMVIFGRPGIGKSTFSLRLAINLALGKDKFLLWNIITKQRVLFISLEMQHYEVKEFFNDMHIDNEEERIRLQENFFIWPIGNPYPFDTKDQQLELIKHIKTHKIECIIIDSLSIAMYGSVKNDDDIKRLNSFLNEDIRRDLKCSYIFIHHPRKKDIGEQKKDDDLDDGFGSTYINANAQTVVILSQKTGSTRVHVKILKSRMAMGLQNFDVDRTPDRGFILAGAVGSTSIEAGETTPIEGRTTKSLGKLLEI